MKTLTARYHRPSRRSLFKRDGSPCAALQAVLVANQLTTLEQAKDHARAGELTVSSVLSCRGNGTIYRPSKVCQYLFGSPKAIRHQAELDREVDSLIEGVVNRINASH